MPTGYDEMAERFAIWAGLDDDAIAAMSDEDLQALMNDWLGESGRQLTAETFVEVRSFLRTVEVIPVPSRDKRSVEFRFNRKGRARTGEKGRWEMYVSGKRQRLTQSSHKRPREQVERWKQFGRVAVWRDPGTKRILTWRKI